MHGWLCQCPTCHDVRARDDIETMSRIAIRAYQRREAERLAERQTFRRIDPREDLLGMAPLVFGKNFTLG